MDMTFPTFVRASSELAAEEAAKKLIIHSNNNSTTNTTNRSNTENSHTAPQKSLLQLVIEANGQLGLVPQRVAPRRVPLRQVITAGHLSDEENDNNDNSSDDEPSKIAAAAMSVLTTRTSWTPPVYLLNYFFSPAVVKAYMTLHGITCTPGTSSSSSSSSSTVTIPPPLLRLRDLRLPLQMAQRLRATRMRPSASRDVRPAHTKTERQQQLAQSVHSSDNLGASNGNDGTDQVDVEQLKQLVFAATLPPPLSSTQNDTNARNVKDDEEDDVVLRGLQSCALSSLLLGNHTLLCGPAHCGKRTTSALALGTLLLTTTTTATTSHTEGHEEESKGETPSTDNGPRALCVFATFAELIACGHWLSDAFGPEAFRFYVFAKDSTALEPLELRPNTSRMNNNINSYTSANVVDYTLQPTVIPPVSTLPPVFTQDVVGTQAESTVVPPVSVESLMQLVMSGATPTLKGREEVAADVTQPPITKTAKADVKDNNKNDVTSSTHHKRQRRPSRSRSRRRRSSSGERRSRSRKHKRRRHSRSVTTSHHHHHYSSSDRHRRHGSRDAYKRRKSSRSHRHHHRRHHTDSEESDRSRGHHRRHSSRRHSTRHHSRHVEDDEQKKEVKLATPKETVNATLVEKKEEVQATPAVIADTVTPPSVPVTPPQPLTTATTTTTTNAPVLSIQRHEPIPILLCTLQSLEAALELVDGATAELPLEHVRYCYFSHLERALRPPYKKGIPNSYWLALSTAVDVECQYIFTASRIYHEVHEFVLNTLIPDARESFVQWTQKDETLWTQFATFDVAAAHVTRQARPRKDATAATQDITTTTASNSRYVSNNAESSGRRWQSESSSTTAAAATEDRVTSEDVDRAKLRHLARLIIAHKAECNTRQKNTVGNTSGEVRTRAEGNAYTSSSSTTQGDLVVVVCTTRREQQLIMGALPQLLQGLTAAEEQQHDNEEEEAAENTRRSGTKAWHVSDATEDFERPGKTDVFVAAEVQLCDARWQRMMDSVTRRRHAFLQQQKKQQQQKNDKGRYTAHQSNSRSVSLLVHFSLPRDVLNEGVTTEVLAEALEWRTRALIDASDELSALGDTNPEDTGSTARVQNTKDRLRTMLLMTEHQMKGKPGQRIIEFAESIDAPISIDD